MSDYQLSVEISGDASKMKKAFNDAVGTLSSFSNGLKSTGQGLIDQGKKGLLGAAAITGGFTKMIMGSRDFEAAMRQATVLTGGNYETLKAAALDMAKTSVYSTEDVASSLAELGAKGMDATQAIDALPGILAAAAASGEDLELVSSTVTSAINAFGLEASASGHIADVMAEAANKSAAGVDDLGYAFKYAAPAASALGISMEELAAATGIMTNQGMRGMNAGTTLRQAFSSLASPTSEATRLMKSLGFSAVDANGNMKGLSTIVGDLNTSMEGMTETQKLAALTTIFGTEASAGMLMLLKSGKGTLDEFTQSLENSDGAAKAAADGMLEGWAGALKVMSSNIDVFLRSFTDALAPAIEFAADAVSRLTGFFTNLDPRMQKIVAITLSLVAGLGLIVPVAKILIGYLLVGLSKPISPITMLVAGIAAIGAALIEVLVPGDSFIDKLKTLGQWTVDLAQKGMALVQGFLPSLKEGFLSAGQSAMDTVQKIGAFIQKVMESDQARAIFSGIASAAKGIWEDLQNVFSTVTGIIQAVVPVIQEFAQAFMSGFGQAQESASGFSIRLSTLLMGLNPLLKLVIYAFSEFGPQVVQAFQAIANQAIPVVQAIGEALGTLISSVLPTLAGAFMSLLPVIMQVVGMGFSAIMQVVPVVMNLFAQLVPILMMVVQNIVAVAQQIIPLVANLATKLIPVIQTVISVVLNIINSVAPAVIAVIQAAGAAVNAMLPIISMLVQGVIMAVTNIIATITPIIAFIGMVISSIVAIISPIVSFIAGIMTAIYSTIQPITTFVSGVFTTVASIISGVWQSVSSFTGTIFNTIGSIISSLSGVVSSVFNSISGTISRVMNGVSNTIRSVFEAIKGAWGGLNTFVQGVFNGVAIAVQSLVGQVKGFVNGVIGGINAAIWLINKIPGVNIGSIPYLARGTDDWQGGFARINEGGRGELTYLPGGTVVVPHDVSMKYAREAARADWSSSETQAGPTIVDVNVELKDANIYDTRDIAEIARELGEHVAKEVELG